jgi:hypothetical protein
MLYGIYRDYYATTTKNIVIENTPEGAATAEVVDSLGNLLASAPIVLDNARIDVAKYHYPLDALIKVYDANGVELASTPILHTIYGGDLYYTVGPTLLERTIETVTSTADTAIQTVTGTLDNATGDVESTINTANQTVTSTINTVKSQILNLTIESADLSGNKFEGMWVELWREGILIQEGYTPFSTYVQNGIRYEVFIDNFQNIIFDHWEDGSTDPRREIIPTEDTNLIAYFRIL